MTDVEIIKALECPISEVDVLCTECPYRTHKGLTCHSALAKDALDLINRQKAEIERLEQIQSDNEKAFNKMTELYNKAFNRCKTAKAEAIKEFAERLKNLVHHTVFSSLYGVMLSISENDFDNLVKEMVGEGNV